MEAATARQLPKAQGTPFRLIFPLRKIKLLMLTRGIWVHWCCCSILQLLHVELTITHQSYRNVRLLTDSVLHSWGRVRVKKSCFKNIRAFIAAPTSNVATLRCLIVTARLLLGPCWTYPPWWPIWTVFLQECPSWLLIGPCFYSSHRENRVFTAVIDRTVFLH